jgi:lysozyme
MNLIRYIKTLQRAEGRVINEKGQHIPYQDNLGVWTIGYGQTHWLGKPVNKNTKPISEKHADVMLYSSAVKSVLDAGQWIAGFNNLDRVRQEALSEMAFQLGKRGQHGFKKAKAAGDARNWGGMAAELIDSLWFEQTPNRCHKISQMILTGIHPHSFF